MKIIEILSRLKFLPSSRHLNCQFVREIAVAFPLKREVVANCTLDVFCDRRREFGAAVAANGQCDLDQHTRKVHCAECADGLKTVAIFFRPVGNALVLRLSAATYESTFWSLPGSRDNMNKFDVLLNK